MSRNVGTWDRVIRALAAVLLATCAVQAPFELYIRLLAFAAPALYLLGTAIAGRCFGYALTGRRTCALPERGG